MKLFIYALFMLLSATLMAQKKLVFTDHSYEEQIRTVILYPQQGGPRDNIYPAAVPLQQQNLMLEFDDLQEERNSYYVKLIHCNYDWSKSALSDLDFMSSYNEYPVNDYTLSSNTSLRYFHCRFLVPPVKLPGNYLLVAYREGDEEDIILSKRLLVYTNNVSFKDDRQLQGLGTLKTSNQQLNFNLSYTGIEIVNPYETVHTVIRQNQRWDNARMEVKPSFIREDKKEIEYRFFDQDKHFAAGNEFRFVDFRSLNFPGQNTGRLDRSQRPFGLTVQTDRTRQNDVYAQYRDLNGQFIIENLDYREAAALGDYLYVTFTFAATSVGGPVYVIGAFNNWQKDEESKMRYDAKRRVYEVTILLKQGWYDYQYWVENNSNSYVLEGSHFETENLYEVLIYYRPFRPNADLLIGYFPIPVNQR
jgi:hypothetical protein